MSAKHRPSPLSSVEVEIWDPLHAVLTQLSTMLNEQLKQQTDLSIFELNVLQKLQHAKGQVLRMSDLAHQCHSSLSRLSRVITRLESKDLVLRTTDPKDARITVANLTKLGRKTSRNVGLIHAQLVRDYVFEVLTVDEALQLKILSEKLLSKIKSRGAE